MMCWVYSSLNRFYTGCALLKWFGLVVPVLVEFSAGIGFVKGKGVMRVAGITQGLAFLGAIPFGPFV